MSWLLLLYFYASLVIGSSPSGRVDLLGEPPVEMPEDATLPEQDEVHDVPDAMQGARPRLVAEGLGDTIEGEEEGRDPADKGKGKVLKQMRSKRLVQEEDVRTEGWEISKKPEGTDTRRTRWRHITRIDFFVPVKREQSQPRVVEADVAAPAIFGSIQADNSSARASAAVTVQPLPVVIVPVARPDHSSSMNVLQPPVDPRTQLRPASTQMAASLPPSPPLVTSVEIANPEAIEGQQGPTPETSSPTPGPSTPGPSTPGPSTPGPSTPGPSTPTPGPSAPTRKTATPSLQIVNTPLTLQSLPQAVSVRPAESTSMQPLATVYTPAKSYEPVSVQTPAYALAQPPAQPIIHPDGVVIYHHNSALFLSPWVGLEVLFILHVLS